MCSYRLQLNYLSLQGLCAAMNDPTKVPATGLQAFKEQRLADDITRIHQALVVNTEVKTIPENTFVKEILPILTGEVVSADFPLLMAAVAGSPFSEVDVINDAGETIFRMPSLLERNIINHTESSKRGSLASVFITVEQLARNSPKRADHYLEHEFAGRGIASNINEIHDKRQARWNDILLRYGKTLQKDGSVVDAGVVPKTSNKTIKNKPELDFDNDDGLL